MKQIYPANNGMSTPSSSYSLADNNDHFKFNKYNGAVAQMGERLNGIQEVVGSIPIGSTK